MRTTWLSRATAQKLLQVSSLDPVELLEELLPPRPLPLHIPIVLPCLKQDGFTKPKAIEINQPELPAALEMA